MSKTLRRPMFRGGSVNSSGTGITSGLDDSGYADGGRVAAKVGGFFNFSKPGGLLPTPSYTGSVPQGGLTGLTQSYQSLAPYIPGPKSLTKGLGPLSIAAAPFYIFEEDPLRESPKEQDQKQNHLMKDLIMVLLEKKHNKIKQNTQELIH